MADLKNRFDKIFGDIAAKEPVKVEAKPTKPKWELSSFCAPTENKEVIDWEGLRRSTLPEITPVHPLLVSSLSIYEDSLSTLMPGVNLEVIIQTDSDKASEILMQACSRMNLKLQNSKLTNDCFLVRSTVSENGVQVRAIYNDGRTQDIHQLIFEQTLPSSKQVDL